MTRILGKLIAIILMLSFILGSALKAFSAQTNSLVEGNTAFALDLYAQLKTSPGNLFFSPYSISTCLAMTYAGAHGETETQIARVLHFEKEQRQLHSSFGELQRQLSEAGKQKGIELNIANALWAQKSHPLLPAFLEIAKGEYQKGDFLDAGSAKSWRAGKMVGATGFEPATSWSQTKCSTRLSYAPRDYGPGLCAHGK